MSTATIRVSSRALGPRLTVYVYVYETVNEMRRAATAYNGAPHTDSLGVTQVTTDSLGKDARVNSVTVRLARNHLGTRVVVHEMNHAAVAWYGSTVGARISSRAHLNQANEPLAHMASDLTGRLVDRLYALGYYDRPDQ